MRLEQRVRALGVGVELNDYYREFCGLWSEEEGGEFDAPQEENSRVDPEERL